MRSNEEIIQSAVILFHKDGVDPGGWLNVNPNLLLLLDFVIDYCASEDLPIVVSSLIRKKIPGVSKSVTHQEGRAFDLSVRGWTIVQINRLSGMVNEKFSVGAISYSDHAERECIYEDGKSAGTAPHLHFQVRR